MPTSGDFVWQNAPIMEIIAEVHWKLQSLDIFEGAAIDPFYELLQNKLTAEMAANGYSIVELRAPPDVPKELFPHKVLRLFRRSPGTWPAFQIGPGVFTANIAPPYKGWNEFRENIKSGLDMLLASHPSTEHLQYERLLLKYVNIFDESHGVDSPHEFIKNDLGLKVPLPNGVIELASGGEDSIHQIGHIRMPLASPIGAIGRMDWREVTHRGQQCVNVDILIEIGQPSGITGQDNIIAKFDAARATISNWFEALTSQKIQPKLGEKISV